MQSSSASASTFDTNGLFSAAASAIHRSRSTAAASKPYKSLDGRVMELENGAAKQAALMDARLLQLERESKRLASHPNGTSFPVDSSLQALLAGLEERVVARFSNLLGVTARGDLRQLESKLDRVLSQLGAQPNQALESKLDRALSQLETRPNRAPSLLESKVDHVLELIDNLQNGDSTAAAQRELDAQAIKLDKVLDLVDDIKNHHENSDHTATLAAITRHGLDTSIMLNEMQTAVYSTDSTADRTRADLLQVLGEVQSLSRAFNAATDKNATDLARLSDGVHAIVGKISGAAAIQSSRSLEDGGKMDEAIERLNNRVEELPQFSEFNQLVEDFKDVLAELSAVIKAEPDRHADFKNMQEDVLDMRQLMGQVDVTMDGIKDTVSGMKSTVDDIGMDMADKSMLTDTVLEPLQRSISELKTQLQASLVPRSSAAAVSSSSSAAAVTALPVASSASPPVYAVAHSSSPPAYSAAAAAAPARPVSSTKRRVNSDTSTVLSGLAYTSGKRRKRQ